MSDLAKLRAEADRWVGPSPLGQTLIDRERAAADADLAAKDAEIGRLLKVAEAAREYQRAQASASHLDIGVAREALFAALAEVEA